MRYAYHSHKKAQKAQIEFLLILRILCFFVAKTFRERATRLVITFPQFITRLLPYTPKLRPLWRVF